VGGEERCIECLIGTFEELERPRRRWKGYVKMVLQDVGLGHGLD
jgi:hypothetical protein